MARAWATEAERPPATAPRQAQRPDDGPWSLLQTGVGNRAMTAMLRARTAGAVARSPVPWTAGGNRAAAVVARQAVGPKAVTQLAGMAREFARTPIGTLTQKTERHPRP